MNENGVSTGKAVSRRVVYENGLWHRSIIVANLNNNNEILLQQRSATKDKYPNAWDLTVAGHIPYGEDSMSAVVAETMQEVGYVLPKKLTTKDFRFISCFRNRFKLSENYIGNQFYDFFVFNKNILFKELDIQKDEVQDIKYVSIPKLLKMKEERLLHPRTEWVDLLVRYVTRQH